MIKLYFRFANDEIFEFGFNASNIGECCRNNRKTHKKFIWKYKK